MALQNKRASFGYVYFIKPKHREGPVKIGFAIDLAKRLCALQIGCFYELEIYAAVETTAPRALEGRLHKQLRKWRGRGEWFAGSREVYETILGLEGVFTPLGEYRNGDWTLRNRKTLPVRHFAA